MINCSMLWLNRFPSPELCRLRKNHSKVMSLSASSGELFPEQDNGAAMILSWADSRPLFTCVIAVSSFCYHGVALRQHLRFLITAKAPSELLQIDDRALGINTPTARCVFLGFHAWMA